MEFNNCKLTVDLIAQSPMVHFQWDEVGATLRGSELKPKLDRFLSEKSIKNNIKLPDGAYIDKEKNAFNYKVTVERKGESAYCALCDKANNKNEFSFVFGDRNKYLIMADVQLTIFCMNIKLQELIAGNITEFFAVTNFGFRQDKGFGSFMPQEFLDAYKTKKNSEKMIKIISGWLKENCKAQSCYYMDFYAQFVADKDKQRLDENHDKFDFYKEMFKQMKDFYDLLKTGRNGKEAEYSRAFIYQYMNTKGIGNEKAWMKYKKIAPTLATKKNASGESKHTNSKYVRALLGIGSHVEYLNNATNRSEKVKVTINNELIERMESTILFKIVGGYVFICAKRIPEEIYGKDFKFVSALKRPAGKKGSEDLSGLVLKQGKKGTISVPSKEELEKVGFSIDNLLEQYVEYYNNKTGNVKDKNSSDVLPSVDGNKKVEAAGGDMI